MAGHECYHCKQWIEEGEAHDCWTTTEAALTKDLSDDLRDAWERLRETAVEFGDQHVYASHHSIMFSHKSCYFFVRPRTKFLEVCVFLAARCARSPGAPRRSGFEDQVCTLRQDHPPGRGRGACYGLAAAGLRPFGAFGGWNRHGTIQVEIKKCKGEAQNRAEVCHSEEIQAGRRISKPSRPLFRLTPTDCFTTGALDDPSGAIFAKTRTPSASARLHRMRDAHCRAPGLVQHPADAAGARSEGPPGRSTSQPEGRRGLSFLSRTTSVCDDVARRQ